MSTVLTNSVNSVYNSNQSSHRCDRRTHSSNIVCVRQRSALPSVRLVAATTSNKPDNIIPVNEQQLSIMNIRTVTLRARSAQPPMMGFAWANELSYAHQLEDSIATGLSTGRRERFCLLNKPSDCALHPRISENAV
jgi:hypothetical protein